MGNCETSPAEHGFTDRQQANHSFNPFFQVSQVSQENDILSKYIFISNYEDKFLGRCNVIKEKSTSNLHLSKDIFFQNQEQLQRAFQTLAQKRDRESQEQNILRIKQVFITKTDGFFSDSTKIILVIEYPLISLKKQFNNRLLNKLVFESEEIKEIMFSAIRGYAVIQRSQTQNSSKLTNDKIRMAHIFVGVESKQSLIKVVDSGLLPSPTNLECLFKYGKSNNEHHDVYLSPQEVYSYAQDRRDGNLINSGVFSLGLTILDLCLMDSSAILYHYGKKEPIVESQLRNLIKIAGKNHNAMIEKVLNLMLEMNPQNRPNFNELQQSITNQFNNLKKVYENNGLRLSVVKNESQYVMNDNVSLRSRSRSGSRKGSVYDSQSVHSNRIYSSHIKMPKPEQEQELQNIHEEYTNGNQFIGQKKSGLKHGKGKYIFKDRSYYQGKWRNNMMHGKGILYYPNGKIEYKGQWKEDEPHGWGELYSLQKEGVRVSWKKYEGEVMKGEMHGRGKVSFINGSIFQGEFFGNKILGKGRLITTSHQIIQRQWPMQTIQEFNNTHNNKIIQHNNKIIQHNNKIIQHNNKIIQHKQEIPHNET